MVNNLEVFNRLMFPRSWLCWILAPLLAAAGGGQELDTVTFHSERKRFRLLDRIQNPAERQAFVALLRENDPKKKNRLAELFLAKYSRSTMLSQAYEIAAKASIDLGNYPPALLYAGESLKLLPENPLLLVPLANVQVQAGLPKDAERSAREALGYLDRFDRPAGYSKQRWKQVERQLRASCYYVLAKAAAVRATAAGNGQGRKYWRQARALLAQSREYNPEDPLAAYLFGLAEQSLGRTEEAALQFADATLSHNPVKTTALQKLRRIHASGTVKTATSFEDYVAALISDSARKRSKLAAPPSEPEPAKLTYAGSQSCRGCHRAEHAAWEQTGMARMLRPYRRENVIGDFESENTFRGDNGLPLVRMFIDDDRHYFAFRDTAGHGQWQRRRVDYTIGSKWQQAYATRLPSGRIHVFPIQYSTIEKRWINFWKIIDDAGSERAVVGDFPKMSSATSYQLNCAPCHTSQLRTVSGRIEPEDFQFREAGVNCEMCHGPSARHVEAMQAGKPYRKPPMEPPVDFSSIAASDFVAICGQCHMQSGVAELGADGAINYSGKLDFVKRRRSRPYLEYSQKAFYKDGSFRETTFIVESFLRSACFKRGAAHCGHCHDPHPGDAASNPKSLKFLDEPNQMCLQCHREYASDIEAHTHHPASSEAGRCTSCHMPPIMNSLLFKAGTHRIDHIPRAEPTLRFGQQESPNACLLCHTDNNGQWVLERMTAWKQAR